MGPKTPTPKPKNHNAPPKEGAEKDRGVILGVCNQIFRREYAHWPNFVVLGESGPNPNPESPPTCAL